MLESAFALFHQDDETVYTSKQKLDYIVKVQMGSDVSSVTSTALTVFGAAQTYNVEAVGVDDILVGDNTDGAPNILFDKSAGEMHLRLGTEVHVRASAAGFNIGLTGRPAYERTYS